MGSSVFKPGLSEEPVEEESPLGLHSEWGSQNLTGPTQSCQPARGVL